uniref:RNA binding motif, single stranded interacting protein n=1 Tax=Neolamprologus brichardi TaxID=32507 RepID=A0A3Q4H2D7_NEOBR
VPKHWKHVFCFPLFSFFFLFKIHSVTTQAPPSPHAPAVQSPLLLGKTSWQNTTAKYLPKTQITNIAPDVKNGPAANQNITLLLLFLFCRYGKIVSTKAILDKNTNQCKGEDANGLSRGVGFARMESTEKCDVVIQNFNGKFLKTPPGMTAPSEPLLCKFADGGQKKRQTQVKYPQNGRSWTREGESGMALTYDPTAMQNGFYSSPYSISTNRMIAQTSITPFIAASPVPTYQVTDWICILPFLLQGAVITPAAAIEPSLSIHPSSVMAPLTQQMNHLSLGPTGTVSLPFGQSAHRAVCYMPAAAAAPMQGTYIPQYTAVPASAITGVVTDPSPQTAAPSSQDASGQQPLPVENTGDHATAYSYQQTK